MIKQKPVQERVLALLAELQVDGQLVRRHPSKLDRNDYLAMNTILEVLGGKWDRRANGHVFEGSASPAAKIEFVLLTGTYTDVRSDYDFFPTPAALAAELVSRCGVRPGDKVLEPSAGKGAIALAARAAGGKVKCVEIEPGCVAELRSLGFETHAKDFLTLVNGGRGFDRIPMNPPFSGRVGLAHVRHAYDHHLATDGRLVSVLGAGVTFRTDKVHTEFRAWVAERGGTIEPLPDGSFKESGTMVRTVLVTLERPL